MFKIPTFSQLILKQTQWISYEF